MTRFSHLTSFWLLALALLSAPKIFAEQFDIANPPAGISAEKVIQRLAEGYEYTEDGEIVPAPGKRLKLDYASRIALRHFIVRTRPLISITLDSVCADCKGVGFVQKYEYDPNIFGDLGRWGPKRTCSACGGRVGPLVTSYDLEVVWSGPLPKLEPSPKLILFKGKLNSARDGNPTAQLEVAKGYLEGKVIPKSVNDALKWFTEAAKQGERDALAPLSQLYLDPANSFHDYAYGLALSAVADSTLARVDGPDFVAFDAITNNATDPEAGLNRYLQVVEAGLLAPRISQGLNDKAQIEKVLSPELVRKSFPLKAPITAAALADKRALFVRGVARYFGYGFAAPDRSEALRLIEEAACKQDAEAFLMVALHYDTAKEYPASEPTAWAFYSLARSLGSTNPFCLSRLSKLAETDVAVDWAGAPEALLVHLQQGRFTPAVIRDLADLSLYRIVRPAAAAPGAPNPFDTAATQETPLSKAQVISKARSMLHLKLKVIEIAPDDECVFRKCWDDGTNRFYAVSGIVTFTNAESRRETAPFTVCFKAADASSTPVLLYCSAGSSLFGEFPSECGRRP
jgi:TPR repeat protein